MNIVELHVLKSLQDEYTAKMEILEGIISRGIEQYWLSVSNVSVENIVITADSIFFVPYTSYMDDCDKETFSFPYEAFESDEVLFKYFSELMEARKLEKKQKDEARRLANKRRELEYLCKELGVKSPLDNKQI